MPIDSPCPQGTHLHNAVSSTPESVLGSMTCVHGLHSQQSSLLTASYHTLSFPHSVPFLVFSPNLKHLPSHPHIFKSCHVFNARCIHSTSIGLSLSTPPGSLPLRTLSPIMACFRSAPPGLNINAWRAQAFRAHLCNTTVPQRQ